MDLLPQSSLIRAFMLKKKSFLRWDILLYRWRPATNLHLSSSARATASAGSSPSTNGVGSASLGGQIFKSRFLGVL